MKKQLYFSKMQALGNDFMIIDTISNHGLPSENQIQRLSDRHYGVGFDQLLIISPASDDTYDFDYQIFNADGSEVGQCGNGARCVAHYIHQYLSPEKRHFRLKTKTTTLELFVCSDNQVRLTLPSPNFLPIHIPLNADLMDEYSILNIHEEIKFHALSVGNPHAIVMIKDHSTLENMDISLLGHFIENHPIFPKRCNVNFVTIVHPEKISIRVWERGCGETLACGSGALASAAVARKFYHSNAHITVQLKGGELDVYWPNLDGPIEQTGPAIEVFRGQISL